MLEVNMYRARGRQTLKAMLKFILTKNNNRAMKLVFSCLKCVQVQIGRSRLMSYVLSCIKLVS